MEPETIGLEEILRTMNGRAGVFLMHLPYLIDGQQAKTIVYIKDPEEVRRQMKGKKNPQILWEKAPPDERARDLIEKFEDPVVRNWKGNILYFKKVVEGPERDLGPSYG